jgi:hypothetical protein
MDLLPPEPPDFWKFRLVAGVAAVAAVGGLTLIADSDLATLGGMAGAAAGAASVALSLAGFLHYWHNL